ncbi:MAG: zinc-dependent alcohol dehydrogenase family protein [Bacteroidota bacterium]
MRAAVYHKFKGAIIIENVPDPIPTVNGVVIKVKATGICRSDWHGWMGHDPDITLPHVPGHELAGTIVEVGKEVRKWKVGDRVTLPFVCGCGKCEQCSTGNEQVCDYQFQPGFTHWGSFAEYVAINYAENNLVRLPDKMTFETAASLGCRFITSFRAIIHQGKVKPNEWVAVHGCGGVGLSAIMIAKAMGANVIGIDINDDNLRLAKELGAKVIINARKTSTLIENIKSVSSGGVHLSIDALGSKETAYNSIKNLRKRGRHVQVGLVAGKHTDPPIPMGDVIANELEIYGSHGMQAHQYPKIFELIKKGKLHPEKMIAHLVDLQTGIEHLIKMDEFKSRGITVINKFD